MQLGAADGDPSWGHVGLGWANSGCLQGLEVLGEPAGRKSAQGLGTRASMDERCEWLYRGRESLSPCCFVFPHSLGPIIQHPNIALPIFEPPLS